MTIYSQPFTDIYISRLCLMDKNEKSILYATSSIKSHGQQFETIQRFIYYLVNNKLTSSSQQK
jgi:hypothetical protein